MKRRLLALFALALALAPLAVGPASAQSYLANRPIYGRGYRPQLSPYLNLLRNNGDPAVNYYLGTLPEFQRRQNDLLYRQQIDILESKQVAQEIKEEEPEGPPPPLPQTGQAQSFGNTKGRYNFTGAFFPPVALPPGVVRRQYQR